jgi:hypothetical protein
MRSKTYPILVRLHNSFVEWWALQVAHYWGKQDMTETHAAMPIIARISCTNISLPWVPALTSGAYRSKIAPQIWQQRQPFNAGSLGPIGPKICHLTDHNPLKSLPNSGTIAALLPEAVTAQKLENHTWCRSVQVFCRSADEITTGNTTLVVITYNWHSLIYCRITYFQSFILSSHFQSVR